MFFVSKRAFTLGYAVGRGPQEPRSRAHDDFPPSPRHSYGAALPTQLTRCCRRPAHPQAAPASSLGARSSASDRGRPTGCLTISSLFAGFALSAGVGHAERVLPHIALAGRVAPPRIRALRHAAVLMQLDSRRSVAGTGYATFPLIDQQGASAFRFRPPTQRPAYLRVRLTIVRSIRSSPQCAAAPARPRCRSSGCAPPRAASGWLPRRLHGASRAVSSLSTRIWIAQVCLR